MKSPAYAVVYLCACAVFMGCDGLGTSELSDETDTSDPAVPDTSSPNDIGSVDTTPPSDTTPTPNPGGPDPAPEWAEPTRSAATDALYCGLSGGQMVQGALRAHACLQDVYVVGMLDDAARGFVWGEVMQSGYFSATYGDCNFLVCLNNADNCEQAVQCAEARQGANCEALGASSSCDGSTLQVCMEVGREGVLTDVQDCARAGGRCVQADCEAPDCNRPSAWCELPRTTAECASYYGACDGDNLVRCSPADPSTETLGLTVIPCNELVENGTCREFAVGGEVPAPACVRRDSDCSVGTSEGFQCLDETTLQYCLFGERRTLRCTDYGYARCAQGDVGDVRCE
jgi:hypothetical protein